MTSSIENLDMPGFQAEGNLVTRRVDTPLLGRPSEELACIESEGALHFEGDIRVYTAMPTPNISEFPSRDKYAVVLHGHGVDDANSLWPGGVIPCAIHDDVSDLVRAAIQYWTTYTPFQFTNYTGQPAHVSFEPGRFNDSPVGRQGRKQIVNLIPNTTLGWAIHEIGHSIGLWHEHSRNDRDQHIIVHPENVRPGMASQFAHQLQNADLIGDYDYDSAMHYPEDAFAREGTLSISRLDGGPLGPRIGLSAGDVSACRRLYPSLSW